ncbi:50S ribosomal protein L28 [Candidatus Parcubacteria bacterium]|jgi:large subunit ribosomal protein L28|nr:50S ribosomal protein L28 [bacterium]MBT6691793.1 50S ribosomal protein L28 [Candidatus Parcubacteria bacterium]
MAKVCDICSRGKVSGNRRSHSNNATKRTMKINLQSKKLGGSRMTICTSCLKTLNKLKKKQATK